MMASLLLFFTLLSIFLVTSIAFQPLYATKRGMNEKWLPKPTWERKIAGDIQQALQTSDNKSPYMVACVGIPGSGKTTSARVLQDLLEHFYNISTFVMPFDGYHYSIAELKEFPDAKDAIYRRGAPDTFNAEALQKDLDRIRNGKEPIIKVPGFDHSKGDPEADEHVFDRSCHNVVICEGLYLLHNDEGWQDIQSLFDCSIFVDANIDTCIDRLKVRNKGIPGYTAEEIDIRCDVVDRANAMTVIKSKTRADIIVQSRAA